MRQTVFERHIDTVISAAFIATSIAAASVGFICYILVCVFALTADCADHTAQRIRRKG